MPKEKILPLKKLFIRLKNRKAKKVGLITGCFDICHLGHVKLFSFAKKYCDILVVGVESDKTVKLSKGKNRPVNKQKVRMLNLSLIKDVDFVFPINLNVKFGEKNISEKYTSILKELKPDILITNFYKDKYLNKKLSTVRNMGIKVKIQKSFEDISTTEIFKTLKII